MIRCRAMTKKAKPGPKPMDPAERKVQIPVRVEPKVRKQLDEKRQRSKLTLSRLVELLLVRQLAGIDYRGDHHFWFGLLMARIAWEVEQEIGLNPPFFASS